MKPPWGYPPVTPRGTRKLQVLHIHAGVITADFKGCLIQLIAEFNQRPQFAFVDLHVAEVDLSKKVHGEPALVQDWKHQLDFIKESCHIVIALPAYSSFSCARHATMSGPRPVRDKTWPRGKPGLTGEERILVDAENMMADFSIAAVGAAFASGSLVFFACPEDLGKTWRGNPASLWQWQSVRLLETPTLLRGAVTPQDWAKEGGLKPTGVLTNSITILENKHFHKGWPEFDRHGKYTGPLPPLRNVASAVRQPSLTAAVEDTGDFDTKKLVAFPFSMTLKLTACLLTDWESREVSPGDPGTPEVGDTSTPAPAMGCLVADSPAPAPATPPITQAPEPAVHTPSAAAAVRPGIGQSGPGHHIASATATDNLRELEPVLMERLPGTRTQLDSSSSLLSLGLLPFAKADMMLKDVEVENRPALPLLNTVLTERLKLAGLVLNWTCLDVGFTSIGKTSFRGRAVSTAAIFSPGGAAHGSATLHRADGRDHSTP